MSYWKRILPLAISILLMITVHGQLPSEPYEATDTAKVVQGHAPGKGVDLINKPDFNLNFSILVTVRYLNQKGLDDSYTDAFGRTYNVKQRQDLQFQKAILYFKGWLFDPKFRYVTYVWTANASQGLPAQVVVAGNLQYQLNKHFDLGIGIGGYPSNRTLLGSFPIWNRQDTRNIADEFLRASYSTGIWLQGEIVPQLYYKTMLGNNLSQLGIDAGQLDNNFDTWSTAVWWNSKKFPRLLPFGDFDRNNKLQGSIGLYYTRSNEDRQSQPGQEAPENTQLRLSDGTSIFALNAFNNGSVVTQARYQMASISGGIKYKGLSVDADVLMRRIDNLKASDPVPKDKFLDKGFVLQASYMLVPRTLMAYATGSRIEGQYGDPSDFTLGLNWYAFKNKSFRINPEFIHVNRSPVGYGTYPFYVGSNGSMFMFNLELYY